MIVLDTNIWIWWSDDQKRLSPDVVAAIRGSEADGILVSVLSVWEIAIKVASGRLTLPLDTRQWIERAGRYPGVRVIDLNRADAISSAELPGHLHGDPFDRGIVALARRTGSPLLTADKKIIDYPHVRTIH